jgi:hypothetical protein
MANTHRDFIEVSISGLGFEAYPNSFELNLALNAIPTLSVEILPLKNKTQEKNASKVDVQEIVSLYRELQTKAKSKETKVTVNITSVMSEDPTCLRHFININNWILTDVGLSQISPTSAPNLVVTLAHPAEVLDRTGYIYEFIDNATQLNKELNSIGGSSLVSLMDAAYNLVKSQLKLKDLPDTKYDGPDDEMKSPIQQFRTQGISQGMPSKYLKDMSKKLFMQDRFGGLTNQLKAAIARLVIPTPFCASTLNRLVSNILPSLGLVMRPTYTEDMLEISPYAPWKQAELELCMDRVTSLTMPPMDNYPILGTGMCCSSHDLEHVTGEQTRMSKDERSMNQLFYVPSKAKQLIGKATGGFIENVGDSAVITYMRSSDLGSNENADESLQEAENKIMAQQLLDPRKTYLKETFRELYMRQSITTVTTVFSVMDSGVSEIVPGKVMTIKDGENDSELMCGYVTEVTIRGSTSGDCTTEIHMSHSRAPLGQKSELLVDWPVENEFYE